MVRMRLLLAALRQRGVHPQLVMVDKPPDLARNSPLVYCRWLRLGV